MVVEVVHVAQLPQVGTRDEPHTLEATAKDEVNRQSHHRQEHEHEHPSDRLDWVAVLPQDHADDRNHTEHVQHREDVVQQIGIWEQLSDYHRSCGRFFSKQ